MIHPRDSVSKGVSLLELLIYLAVFSIIVVVLTSIFPVIVRVRATANARFEVQENLRSALEKIQQTVFDAGYSETGGSCPLNTLGLGVGTATTTFQVVSGRLQIREADANPFSDITSANVSVAVSDGATCLFTKVANPTPAKSTIQIKIKVSYNDQGRPELKFSDLSQLTISLR